jgi:iron complex outermembrane receptor protein
MGFRVHPLAAAVAVLFSGAAVSSSVLAQDKQAAPTALDDVVVHGKREPAGAGFGDPSSVSGSELRMLRPATSDTATLMRDVPGMQFQSAGGTSSLPVIRGLADDRNRILVDGMDLIASCPNHMNPPLSYLDPSNVTKLTVYPGIGPVSVGGDSIGGTIIAASRPLPFAAPGAGLLTTGEIGAFYRSNGDAWGGNIYAAAANESLSVAYTGSYAQSDNYKAGDNFKTTTATGRLGHTLPLNEVGSTAYKTWSQQLAVGFQGDGNLVEFKYTFVKTPEQLYPNQRMDMLDNEQQTFNLNYVGQFAWGKLDARIYHETVDHFMDFGPDKRYWYGPGQPPAGAGGDAAVNGFPCSPISGTRMVNGMMVGCAAGMPMYTASKNTGGTVAADINLSEKDLLRVGGLYQHYTLDDWWPPSGAGMWPGTFDNINDGERNRFALFGEWESRLTAQWKTLLGARYENVQMNTGDVRGYSITPGAMGNQVADAAAFNAQDRQRTDNNWNLTALARYTPNEAADIEFGVARKVRSPNLYERYTWSTWSMAAAMNNTVGDGNGYIGNLDLKPEVAHTIAATFDWHAADRSWEIKATPYYSRVTDYIDAVRCTRGASCTLNNATTTNQFVVLQYDNTSATLYGIDISGQAALAQTSVGDFGLRGLIGYVNGENRDTGDGLYNIMPLNARVALTHQIGGWNNVLEVIGVTRKDDVSEVRNEIETPGYGLTNLRLSYSWKQARIDFGVENLFDKFYYMPLGGAYVGQGTTMALNPASGNPAWGTGVPGAGRTIYTGLNLKF